MFADEAGQPCEMKGWEDKSVVADRGGAEKGEGSQDSAVACELKTRKL